METRVVVCFAFLARFIPLVWTCRAFVFPISAGGTSLVLDYVLDLLVQGSFLILGASCEEGTG